MEQEEESIKIFLFLIFERNKLVYLISINLISLNFFLKLLSIFFKLQNKLIFLFESNDK